MKESKEELKEKIKEFIEDYSYSLRYDIDIGEEIIDIKLWHRDGRKNKNIFYIITKDMLLYEHSETILKCIEQLCYYILYE